MLSKLMCAPACMPSGAIEAQPPSMTKASNANAGFAMTTPVGGDDTPIGAGVNRNR